jgi:TRAP transporter 4TM/12TM fusion protein
MKRNLGGFNGKVVTAIAIAASLYHIYALGVVATGMWQLRAIHVMVVLILGPMLYKGWKNASDRKPGWVDWIMVLAGVAVTVYVLLEQDGLSWREDVAPTQMDILFGTVLLVLVLDLTRRIVGWPLVILIFVLMGYTFFASYMPGILQSKSYGYPRMISHLLSIDGFYGIPIGASATYVFLFILFGAFLRASRVGDFFIDLSYAIAGRTRGGPAKVAIFASALMGTIAGSGISNVVTTGTLTIPLMKKTGFRPHFAAAVEAAASTGGQIMPPVMGAAAFLMAEMISVPYGKIVISAALPAILFYLALLFMIDFEAAKEGLKGLPPEELPLVKKVLAHWGHLSIPILILLYMLIIKGTSPIKAALYSMLAALIVSWFHKDSRMGAPQVRDALKSGALGSLEVIIACASAGLVVGLVSLTGIGLTLSSAVLSLSGGNLLIALILSMVIILILSMGLPTTGAYIIAAVVIGPALTKLGVSILQAHMFIFYFACMSGITPPVALVAFPAAGIAGANPVQVGFTAWRLALTAFIIPYFFVYAPSLLFIGPPKIILLTAASALIGVFSLAIGLSGWFLIEVAAWKRILFLAAALALIFPGILTDGIGLGSMAIAVLLQISSLRKRRLKKSLPPDVHRPA